MFRTVLGVLLVILGAGCGASPCTTCMDVSGTSTLHLNPPRAISCAYTVVQTDIPITVLQAGSLITVRFPNQQAITGTLLEDNTLDLSPLSSKTDDGRAATFQFHGTFKSDASFSGQALARVTNLCGFYVPISWDAPAR